jgi:prepilin-type N-terminal cleavage/methylation domain-containing protein
MKNKTSQSGFTLIELIAVMVILGILAAVIIPRITTITSGAYESNVRNMYGVIKNEITAQAVKAAMSGDFLETYPDPGDANENFYLGKWVADYDPSAWSQFQATSKYDNSVSGGAGNKTNILLFMYHPHGRPSGDITWTGYGDQISPAGGTASTNKEDVYWIQYAPRTSARGALVGRQNDGFVMAAWKNGATTDWTFGGSISNAGACVDGGEECLGDLAYILNPAAD